MKMAGRKRALMTWIGSRLPVCFGEPLASCGVAIAPQCRPQNEETRHKLGRRRVSHVRLDEEKTKTGRDSSGPFSQRCAAPLG
jgi:hypothetical protein